MARETMNWRVGLTTAGWVVVGVLLTFVGLKLHARFFSDDAQTYDSTDTRRDIQMLSSEGEELDPAAFIADPMVDDAVVTVDRDPADIAPPAGATRLRADVFESNGQSSHRASYQLDGDMAVTAAYYEWGLSKQGFAPEPVIDSPDGMRQFYFRGQDQASVSLHRVPGDDTMVRVTVIVSESVDPIED
jgi:hypothetical protein